MAERAELPLDTISLTDSIKDLLGDVSDGSYGLPDMSSEGSDSEACKDSSEQAPDVVQSVHKKSMRPTPNKTSIKRDTNNGPLKQISRMFPHMSKCLGYTVDSFSVRSENDAVQGLLLLNRMVSDHFPL